MTLNNIWETIRHNPGWITVIIVLCMSFIEVSKIKINPWSAIGHAIGKFLGIKAVSDKVDAVDKKVDESDKRVEKLEQKIDENEIITARVRILRFAGEIRSGLYHTKDAWDQTMADVEKYEQYVDAHKDFKNGITEPTNIFLKEQYKERLNKNDWYVKNNQ